VKNKIEKAANHFAAFFVFIKTTMQEVKSTCISVCTYDDHKICLGCKRNEYEIINWDEFSNEQKKAVLSKRNFRRSENQDYYGGLPA